MFKMQDWQSRCLPFTVSPVLVLNTESAKYFTLSSASFSMKAIKGGVAFFTDDECLQWHFLLNRPPPVNTKYCYQFCGKQHLTMFDLKGTQESLNQNWGVNEQTDEYRTLNSIIFPHSDVFKAILLCIQGEWCLTTVKNLSQTGKRV
jgi:hypothetical protein